MNAHAPVEGPFAHGLRQIGYCDLGGRSAFKMAIREHEGRWWMYTSTFWEPGYNRWPRNASQLLRGWSLRLRHRAARGLRRTHPPDRGHRRPEPSSRGLPLVVARAMGGWRRARRCPEHAASRRRLRAGQPSLPAVQRWRVRHPRRVRRSISQAGRGSSVLATVRVEHNPAPPTRTSIKRAVASGLTTSISGKVNRRCARREPSVSELLQRRVAGVRHSR